jgi:hypothetical protein
MSAREIRRIFGSALILLFCGNAANAQVNQLCPSLQGAERAACFARDAIATPATAGQASPSAAESRCPSLPEPGRSACFRADDERAASNPPRSAATSQQVFLGPSCSKLSGAAQQSCLGVVAATTTSTVTLPTGQRTQALCPSLQEGERAACFSEDNTRHPAPGGALINPPVNLAGVQCPSLPQAEREACFRGVARSQ